MDELIKIENGVAILDPEVSAKIAFFEQQVKDIKAMEDQLKASILEAMEKRGVIKLDTEDVAITYIAATSRETFDSKNFRAVYPDLYDSYVKIRPVKASIRIKVK